MKIIYEIPEAEIIKFSAEDVIVTSGLIYGGTTSEGDIDDFGNLFPNL